jgi:hypothetical protein
MAKELKIKELKTNKRGEAQLSLWLPEKIVKEIYEGHLDLQKRQEKEGDFKSSFREFFYNKYIKPIHT